MADGTACLSAFGWTAANHLKMPWADGQRDEHDGWYGAFGWYGHVLQNGWWYGASAWYGQ